MTTIAADARAGLMASDSEWNDETEKGTLRKVFRIRGSLIGFAGEWAEIQKAKAWFQRGMKDKAKVGDVSALILSRAGIAVWTPADGVFPVAEKFFATGTGGTCARAAMMAGASVTEAVRIACKIDPGSGGRVRVYKLEP